MEIVKIKFKIVVIIIFFALFSSSAHGEEVGVGKKINMQEAMELAVKENLKLFQVGKDVEIAHHKIKEANRLQNPSASALYLFGQTSVGNPEEFGLSQPIEILKRGPRKREAIAYERLMKTEFLYKTFLLKMDVRRAYVELVSAKSILKIVKEQQLLLGKMVASAQKRYEAGEVHENEYLEARIFLDKWNVVHNNAEKRVMVARYYFNMILNLNNNDEHAYDSFDESLPNLEGKDYSVLLTPSPKVNIKSYEEVERIAFEHRKDIEIAQKEIIVAQKDLRVQLSKRIPDIDVHGGYMYLSSFQNNIYQKPNTKDFSLSGGFIAASVLLPSLYRFTPEIQNAKLEVEKKEANLNATINIARQDLRTAYTNFMVTRKNLNYYIEVLLVESAQVTQQTQAGYQAGKTKLSIMIIMEQARLAILTDYIDVLESYYVAWVELLRQTNVESLD